MNAVAKVSSGDIIELVMVKGDLAKLTADERNAYYVRMCEAVGVNPVTRPFEYITLNGRMVLYARKDCTDQLRKKNSISVTDLTESEREGVYIVTAKVTDHDGRTDIAKGAVNIANLKGEALANAIMKAETKSKRRATLSICGLGMLDETEVEDIVANQPQPRNGRERYEARAAEIGAEAASEEHTENWGNEQGRRLMSAMASHGPPGGDAAALQWAERYSRPHAVPTLPEGDSAIKWAERYAKAIGLCSDVSEFAQWISLNKENIDRCMTVVKARAYIEPAHTAVRRQIKEAMPEDRPVSALAANKAWHDKVAAVKAGTYKFASAMEEDAFRAELADREAARPTSAPSAVNASTAPAKETATISSKPVATFGSDPEAFVKDTLLRLDQAETTEALDLVWERDIAPFEMNLLQEQMDRLYQRYRHRREAMKP